MANDNTQSPVSINHVTGRVFQCESSFYMREISDPFGSPSVGARLATVPSGFRTYADMVVFPDPAGSAQEAAFQIRSLGASKSFWAAYDITGTPSYVSGPFDTLPAGITLTGAHDYYKWGLTYDQRAARIVMHEGNGKLWALDASSNFVAGTTTFTELLAPSAGDLTSGVYANRLEYLSGASAALGVSCFQTVKQGSAYAVKLAA